jgi:hypothetical protein
MTEQEQKAYKENLQRQSTKTGRNLFNMICKCDIIDLKTQFMNGKISGINTVMYSLIDQDKENFTKKDIYELLHPMIVNIRNKLIEEMEKEK